MLPLGGERRLNVFVAGTDPGGAGPTVSDMRGGSAVCAVVADDLIAVSRRAMRRARSCGVGAVARSPLPELRDGPEMELCVLRTARPRGALQDRVEVHPDLTHRRRGTHHLASSSYGLAHMARVLF